MVETCLINTAIGNSLCIQDYMLVGILMMALGLVVASFIPFDMAKKLGVGLFALGVLLTFLFPLIKNWWMNSVAFQIAIYSLIVFIVIMLILFPKSSKDLVTRKK